MDKSGLRRELRARRRAIEPAVAHRAARRLAGHLGRLHWFRRSRHIGFYWPADGEISALPAIQRACQHGKHLYLPVLHGTHGQRLRFAPFRPGANLRLNRFAIPEPMVPRRHWRGAGRMDLLLVPLVGFDRAGQRLGMGGGFYDRTLAALAMRRHWRRPRTVGLAYAFQELPSLPREPWDVPLDAVCTEEGCMRSSARGMG